MFCLSYFILYFILFSFLLFYSLKKDASFFVGFLSHFNLYYFRFSKLSDSPYYVKLYFCDVKFNVMNNEQFDFIVKVSEYVQRFGVLTPVADWIGCQFAMESNYGNSRIARERNNFCGMKVPCVRPSLNTAFSGFAAFDSFESCVTDYVLWLAYNKFGYNQLCDVELFTIRLKACDYCPEKDYVFSINNLYNQFKNYKYGKS